MAEQGCSAYLVYTPDLYTGNTVDVDTYLFVEIEIGSSSTSGPPLFPKKSVTTTNQGTGS
jgi:hypothetical protein